jgi:hypothetical protein
MINVFKKLMNWLDGPRLRDSYEDMMVQIAAQENKNELVLDKCPVTGATTMAVNDQITDSVTQVAPAPVVEEVAPAPVVEEVAPAPVVEEVAPAKPKRARTTKGKLIADDKSTPDVNEAWEGGKGPAKKPRKTKKK